MYLSSRRIIHKKVAFGKELEENPKLYDGESVYYIDFCDADQMSLLELNTMIVSCCSERGYFRLWYHLSGTTLDFGLFELESDVYILKMRQMIKPKFDYVEIYVIRMPAIAREYDMGSSQEEILMQNPFLESTQAKIDLEESKRFGGIV